MAKIFISHSSKDNAAALRLRDWLGTQGWSPYQVFLDVNDLKGGDRWRDVLNGMGDDCEVVIACLSDAWLSSHECVREFTIAEERGKPVIPVFIAPVTVPIPRFVSDLQIGDVSDSPGLERLRNNLLKARIEPESFPWPPSDDPTRAVYRGLRALAQEDAAIFFGRDADIARGLARLRQMREHPTERMLVILGASGSGKSSFLRAGLLPRLRRDEERFVVLPVIRPEQAALSGPAGLQSSVAGALGAAFRGTDQRSLLEAFQSIRAATVERLEWNAASAGEEYDLRPPTIVVSVDQAEELYSPDDSESRGFSAMLAGALAEDGNVIVVATMRSDTYGRLQDDVSFPSSVRVPFDLSPVEIAAFKEIIDGPAQLARPALAVEPDLGRKLRADLGQADALPLLAFTLERLNVQFGESGRLTLVDYEERLGGLTGAISSAAEAALGPEPDAKTLANLREAFVPALVHVDESGVRRRAAPIDGLPPVSRPLLERLVEQRLLVSDIREVAGQMATVVEVAHEAVLRQWPLVADWIERERAALLALSALRAAAADWHLHAREAVGGEQGSWLSHRGERLAECEELSARPGFASSLSAGEQEYLAACRRAEDERRASAEVQRLRFLEIDRITREMLAEELAILESVPKSDHGGVRREREEEVELLRFLVGQGGRWHPKEADFLQSTGARDGYAEVFRFQCCGKIALDFLSIGPGDPPSQFRADGCEAIPPEIQYGRRVRSNPYSSVLVARARKWREGDPPA